VNAWILLPMSLSRGGEQVHILSRGWSEQKVSMFSGMSPF
jgi:hypothetical protein